MNDMTCIHGDFKITKLKDYPIDACKECEKRSYINPDCDLYYPYKFTSRLVDENGDALYDNTNSK